MDSQSSKPPSSRRDRDRDKERRRSRDKVRDKYRSRNRDRDRDRGRNRHDRPRSTSPVEPSPKRQRPSESRKWKEAVRDGDREPGKVEVKASEIGDDFIPLGVSDNEATPSEEKRRSEKTRQEEKGAEREWDRGKTTRRDRDEESQGTKRKYDPVFDEEDDWAYRRSQRYERPVARMAPWVSQVDWDSCRNVGEMLHREVEAFVKYMSPTPVEDEIRGLVIQLVSNAITSAFPDARILPFGSYETKLYLPNGDIDLVIDSDSMAYSNKVNVLHALANTLKRAGITSKVSVISRAKVPIVKFVTHFGRLNVDISVNQGNGVAAGQIINGFLNDMPGCGFALRSLAIIAKAFLNQRGMNEVFSGGLGSYSIVCLAVNFLQMHPKIRRGEIEAEKNLGVLVMEFFELYGCYFNYEEVGVSIRNGGSYFSKRQRGWYDSMKNHLLSIEDPTDPANDISKGSYGINKVRQTLAGAYGIMQAAAFLRAGILSSRREGHSYPLRKGTNPEDMSILSSILGVTQETINNRCLLQEVYDKGSLHQLLGVSPKASVVTANASNKHQTKGDSLVGASSVQEAWDEADRALESDDDHRNGVTEQKDPEDTSRYHIQETQRHSNGASRFSALATYTTDEDEEEELSEDELEHQAYDIESDDDDRKSRMSRRRSYWLSKAIGHGQTLGETDEESS
ncbi:hypothetical protein BDN67DRAFT_933948 [Paxillus ammoniavirescens]|nr:hypothetical protein BDN67DRAFT_933948 [Paxillus ammoniavirescens]